MSLRPARRQRVGTAQQQQDTITQDAQEPLPTPSALFTPEITDGLLLLMPVGVSAESRAATPLPSNALQLAAHGGNGISMPSTPPLMEAGLQRDVAVVMHESSDQVPGMLTPFGKYVFVLVSHVYA
jgi:hypothetical protein